MNRKNFYYTNPAFSQQSEFHNGQAPVGHHQKSGSRQSPIGAQTPLYYLEDGQEDEEQEFYEEMLVDEAGVIKQKKVLMVSSPPSECSSAGGKNRYEYIPMQVSPGRRTNSLPRRVVKQQQTQQRYQYVEDISSQRMMDHRYELIADDLSPPRHAAGSRYEYMVSSEIATSSPKRGNPIATQKLYELLQTPKKYDPVTTTTSVTRPIMSPQAHRRSPQTPKSPASPRMVHRPQQLPSPQPHDPFLTPSKHQKQQRPKAQQKLNYALASQQQVAAMRQQDKRHTAIVAPMCSSPVQSVYSEMTFSKSESWMNLRHQQKPTQLTLAVAAMMMTLCGGVTSGLCFYMVSVMGRLYFLDFGTVAGFMCLVLGLLGFRTRNCYWLPNRNYISGYIVMSVLSLLMCAGLLVLLVLQPKPGTPLADMTSGAVCGISVLSLVLASMGVISSYCCKYPPPDNRVQHCAQGFVV